MLTTSDPFADSFDTLGAASQSGELTDQEIALRDFDLSGPDTFMHPGDETSNRFQPSGTTVPTVPPRGFDPPLTLERIDKEFIIFDDMFLTGKPDLNNANGLGLIERYSKHQFFSNNGQINEIDETRTRAFARELDPSELFIINLEHWPTNGTPEVVRETIRKFSQIIDIVREENPEVLLGIYSMVPIRQYWPIVDTRYGYGSAEYEKWTAGNDALTPLAEKVDVIVPSIYAFYPDVNVNGTPNLARRDQWVEYAAHNMKEAKSYGKPVIPYIWPAFHGGGNTPPEYDFPLIGAELWETILETTFTLADSVVIWGGVGKDWKADDPWWTMTEEFLNKVLPVRANAESTVFGEVIAGNYLSTYAGTNGVASILVTDVNDPPIVYDDFVSTPQSTPFMFNIFDDNGAGADYDPDEPLYAEYLVVNGQPAVGELVNNQDGTFLYTPAPGFHGEVSFSYSISDDEGTSSLDTATVTINVNNLPIAENDTVLIDEDQTIDLDVTQGYSAQPDSDSDGTLVPASIRITAKPASGTLEKLPSGLLRFVPNLNFFGTDSFKYKIEDDDGGISNEATVFMTIQSVNDPPVAFDDHAQTEEDETVVIDVLTDHGAGADYDADESDTIDPATLAIVDQPQHGTVQYLGGGEYSYSPNANFAGTDHFTYRVEGGDGLNSNAATVSINISAVNDPPVARDDQITVPEDESVIIAPMLDNTPNDEFADEDVDIDGFLIANSLEIVTEPAHGTVSNLGDGSVQYTPNADFFGTDSFTYTIEDNEGAISDSATVTILVLDVNDAPTAFDDFIPVVPGNLVSFDVLADNGFGADQDRDGHLDPNSIEFTLPEHGELTLRNGIFQYVPDTGPFGFPVFNGIDSFTYTVRDDDSALSNDVTVSLNVNFPPIAQDDSFSIVEDTPQIIDVVAAQGNGVDEDVDGTINLAEIEIVDFPMHGNLESQLDGTFLFTPELNYHGADSFTYRLLDDDNASSNIATVTLSITSVNDSPVAVNDQFVATRETATTIDLLNNTTGSDFDVDGELVPSSIVITANPSHGTLVDNGNGTFEFTPEVGFFGEDSFSYTVEDDRGAVSNTATVTIIVSDLNVPPVANDDSFFIDEDAVTLLNLLADNQYGPDHDMDGTLITESIVILSDPQHGTLVDQGGGVFEYSPNLNYFGEDSFTYTIADDDGETSNVATVSIQIADVNDLPVTFDKSFLIGVDEVLDFDFLADFGEATDFDLDGNLSAASIAIEKSPQFGTLTNEGGSSFRFTPVNDFHGIESFIYTIDDDDGGTSNEATITITVNRAPTATDDAIAATEDEPISIDVVSANGNGSDVDVDGTIQLDSVTVERTAVHGTLEKQPNGTLLYTPDPEFHGTDSFSYRLLDNHGFESNLAEVTIDVQSVNDLPIAEDDSAFTFEGRAVVIDVLLSTDGGTVQDRDSDGFLIPNSVNVTSGPANGFVSIGGDGTVTYSPSEDFFGSDSFTYTVDDDSGDASNEATVTIEVREVNMPPIAIDDDIVTSEEMPITIDLSGLGMDIDGNLLPNTTVVIVETANGKLTNNGDGTFLYEPNHDFFGVDTFSYQVRSENGAPSRAFEVIEEELFEEGTRSRIEHQWTFDLTGRRGEGLVVQALHNSAEEDFTFQYSLDGSAWYETGITVTNEFAVHEFDFPTDQTGTLTVRLTDIDRPSGHDSKDLVFVSEMYIRQTPLPDTTLPKISISDAQVNENGIAEFVISHDGGANSPIITMTVVTGDGTADSTDYTPHELHVIKIPAGQTQRTFSVAITDDQQNESAENFFVILDDPVNAVIEDSQGEAIINPSDRPPTLGDDTIELNEDSSVSIDVLADNGAGVDVDFDEDMVLESLAIVEQPTFGTLAPVAGGEFVYTPFDDFHGQDTFRYSIADETDATSTGTVSITIHSVNDAPQVPPQLIELGAAGQALEIQLVADDGDPELEQVLTFTITSLPANGILSLVEDESEITSERLPMTLVGNSVLYTPAVGDSSDEQFDFFVADDGGIKNGGVNVSASQTFNLARGSVVSLTADLSFDEGQISTITATLSKPAIEPVTIQLIVSGSATLDEDYTLSSLQIQIPANETSGTITITSVDDSAYEIDETLVFEIDSIIGGEFTIGTTPVSTSIINNDQPTQVMAVLVSSSAWTQNFLTKLGSELGHSIPAGDDQLRALPWPNLDKISVVFNRNVTIDETDVQFLGMQIADYEVASFHYDSEAFAATWSLSSPLGVDTLLLRLSESIVGSDGSLLDGDWTNASTNANTSNTNSELSFPSGDGTPGGVFQFRLNTLAGDVNGSGVVAVNDVGSIRVALGQATEGGEYSIFADTNGSGGIGVDDLMPLRINLGRRLPVGEPTFAVAATPSDIDLAFASRVEEERRAGEDEFEDFLW